MMSSEWSKEIDFSLTICDRQGIIVDMNDRAILDFGPEGGAKLIGASVYDCHPEPAKSKLREIMAEERTNVYTIEKRGVKKLIYQTPWYKEGLFCGMVELSIELPEEMPHFVRT